jgi:hypothetical protein
MKRYTALLALLLAAGIADAQERNATSSSHSPATAPVKSTASSTKNEPARAQSSSAANLYLTQRDFQLLLLEHPNLLSLPTKNLEEVIVSGSVELLPMRQSTREIPGGLFAPFWAVANPTQAWRIFLPIPPE